MWCPLCKSDWTTGIGIITCHECSQKLLDYRSSAESVMMSKPEEKMSKENKQEETPNLHVAGAKDDKEKLMWNLLPWKALKKLIEVLTMGARKYSPEGWRSVPNATQRYEAALLRHLSSWKMGERIDPESGLRHIDHALANLIFIVELED